MNSASNDGKWSPFYDAMASTAEEFVSTFGDRLKNSAQGAKDEALFGALLNSNPADRVAIANLVLDAGANAAALGRSDRSSVLHLILSGDRVRDFELEAPLLERLLNEGADINQWSPRAGYPIEKFWLNKYSDEALSPFYDIVFSRSDIDLSVIVNKHEGTTLREFLFTMPEARARLRNHAIEYDRVHP